MKLEIKHKELGNGLQKYDPHDVDAPKMVNSIYIFNKEIWPHIKKYFSKEKRVLDVGCGNGRFSAFFSSHVQEVIAIDPCREMNPVFQRKNIEYHNKSLQDFNNEEKYDVIFLLGVFYLMQNWDTTLAFKNLISKLREDGVLILVDDKKRDVSSRTSEVGCYNTEALCLENGGKIIDSFIQDNNHHKIVVVGRDI